MDHALTDAAGQRNLHPEDDGHCQDHHQGEHSHSHDGSHVLIGNIHIHDLFQKQRNQHSKGTGNEHQRDGENHFPSVRLDILQKTLHLV